MTGQLPFDEQKRVRWVLDWTERMAQKYGGTVYDKSGETWDWGQALCRECYGKDWNNVVPESPSWDDIAKARKWEDGQIPDWVEQHSVRMAGSGIRCR